MADALGLRTQRQRKHGSSASLDVAAGLIRAYLEGLPRGSPAQGRLPTQGELIACGRHDVRFAMQVRSTGTPLPAAHDVQACGCISLADVARMCAHISRFYTAGSLLCSSKRTCMRIRNSAASIEFS